VAFGRFPVDDNPVYQELALLGVLFDRGRVKLVKTAIRLIPVLLILSPYSYGQTAQSKNDNELSTRLLNYRVAHFDLTNSTLFEGLSKLSLEPIDGLHLGIELVLRENFSEPLDRSIQFSLSLQDTTVLDIVDTLCQFDSRYTWSTDGLSINVFPRETIGNSSYLLNRDLEEITLKNLTAPYEALTPLAKLLPGEQIGYAGIGLVGSHSEPWSAVFDHVTVRQLMNRISEHFGPRGGWIWRGSRDQRFFFCFPSGFNVN
jgi:hypothetical protein